MRLFLKIPRRRTGGIPLRLGLIVILLRISSSSASGDTDYVTALKQFLNMDYDGCEMEFSMQNNSDELSNAVLPGGRSISVLKTPLFYRLGIAKDGFITHSSQTLLDIQTRSFRSSLFTRLAGVFSNDFFWVVEGNPVSLGNGNFGPSPNGTFLKVDNETQARLQRDGQSWLDKAHAEAGNALTFGLPIYKGSMAWNGMNFTAETANSGPVPRDKWRKRIVSGRLTLSNGIPSRLTYEFTNYIVNLAFGYETQQAANVGLPSQVTILRRFPASGFSNSYTLVFIDEFSAGLNGPQRIP